MLGCLDPCSGNVQVQVSLSPKFSAARGDSVSSSTPWCGASHGNRLVRSVPSAAGTSTPVTLSSSSRVVT
ncbi:hypothetical protein BDZ89DRAFT_1064377 [Hymenopellis radicata]|nr:hypothetical protein BDZ89DRAFT_1064377 [Hymenopellis radicata]